jgi:hypothetical protein
VRLRRHMRDGYSGRSQGLDQQQRGQRTTQTKVMLQCSFHTPDSGTL